MRGITLTGLKTFCVPACSDDDEKLWATALSEQIGPVGSHCLCWVLLLTAIDYCMVHSILGCVVEPAPGQGFFLELSGARVPV